MKKEDVKVGAKYSVSNGKNEMEVTVVRVSDAGFIVKTKSGKNMPVNDANRFLELIEDAPIEEKAEKKPETAPVAKKEETSKKEPKVSKAVKFLPEKEETAKSEKKSEVKEESEESEEEVPVKKEKKVKKEKAEKKMSMFDAAIAVLEGLEPKSEGLTTREIVGEMEASGLWSSPAGKTPANTLTAIFNRDINTSEEPKVAKASRGKYKLA